MPSIDYARVKQLAPIGEVIRLLGIPWERRSGLVVRGKCLLCCHPDRYACWYDGHKDGWYCHRCKQGGNALELYQRVKSLTLFAAAVELCELLHRELPLLEPPPSRRDKAVKDSDSEIDTGG